MVFKFHPHIRKKPQAWRLRGSSSQYVRGISVCDVNPYHLTTCPWCNPLHIVVDTDASDEHVLARFIVWIFLYRLNTLGNRTAHEIWLIDLVTITNRSHVFFEGQWHPQAGLVRVFNHKQFLSSFWILVTIRVTVSSIRSSLGLLFKDSFFRPHWVLVSCSN